MSPQALQNRAILNLQNDRVRFVITDNDIDIADASAFNTYQPPGGRERVLLDDPNFVDEAGVEESWNRPLEIVDSKTGIIVQFSDQDVSRKVTAKGFATVTREGLQNVRNLLHALRGRAVSFYLPTFYPDFQVNTDVVSSDQVFDVDDVQYVSAVRNRQPRNIVRLHKFDGTATSPKLITGSSVPAPGTERLSIAPDTVGETATVAEIQRLEIIEKVRLDRDDIVIRHFDALGTAQVRAPIRTVLEEDD